MKFTGAGCLRAPGSNRIVWDFDADGVFDTKNQDIIAAAKKQGFREYQEQVVEDIPVIEPMIESVSEPIVEQVAQKKRGRPKKGSENEYSKNHANPGI